MKAKDVSWVWIGSYGAIVERDENNGVTRFVGRTFNIDQRRITEEAIKEMAYKDSLTELGNRRALFEKENEEIEISKRRNQPLSMMMIDIDNFKFLNDTYGGDELLAILLESDKKTAYEMAEPFRQMVDSEELNVPYKSTISIGELMVGDSLENLMCVTLFIIQRVDKANSN